MSEKFVKKRNGSLQAVDFAKIDERLNMLNSRPYQLRCNASFVSQKVQEEVINQVDTKTLDEYASKVAAEMGSYDPDYMVLATRIAVSNHQKSTSDCFSNTMSYCYRNRQLNGVYAPRINAKLYKFVQLHKNRINTMVDYNRDYHFTYFGFTTLMDRYLLKRSGPEKLVEARPQDYAIERPQDMWMRVACAIHMNRDHLEDESVLAEVQETYDLLSLGKIMHATPTLYNLGTLCEQALSCFLMGGADSIEGIGKLKSDMIMISKYSGGIGFWWDLRSTGSEIIGTNGRSNGPVPFLRAVAADMQATNQGGKRPGSAANYIEPTHPDFMHWIKLKRSSEVDNIASLFYAVWMPDEFMRRCDSDDLWYFVDPNDSPLLYTLYGAAYETEYARIIAAKEYKLAPIKARAIMKEICITQRETGTPYIVFKDAANEKTNQKNIGTIKSSNLCAEILEYSSAEEYACCCVSTLCLSKFVVPCTCYKIIKHEGLTRSMSTPELSSQIAHVQGCNGTHRVDYDDLARCAGVVVRNLNKIIDLNFYPVPEARRSNLRHRPLAIGCQALADMFCELKYPFTSPEAVAENKRVFETIYYGAMRASNELAIRDGPYQTFLGDPLNNPNNPEMPSPFSQGIFQFDMWPNVKLMGRWDWTALKASVRRYGVRNSLLTSLPPTASTSHIQGNNECHEPFTDNIYVRKTLSGENMIINTHLTKILIERNLWTADVKAALIEHRGSIQNIAEIPQDIKDLFKTVWELNINKLIDMDADRAPFVDQTMSSNRFMLNPSERKLIRMHMHCWRRGLKTGMYYLRSQSASKAKQSSESVKKVEPEVCRIRRENGVICYSCQ
jgi:ribonucleoside-diphosphate reductase alpha subunit